VVRVFEFFLRSRSRAPRSDTYSFSPVFTYSGRATTKPGVRPSEHSIVHTVGYQPRLLPGEGGIVKESIGVEPPPGTSVEPPLNRASRINFGIHHPIQYNVKVKDLGTVSQGDIPKLIGYWQEEQLQGALPSDAPNSYRQTSSAQGSLPYSSYQQSQVGYHGERYLGHHHQNQQYPGYGAQGASRQSTQSANGPSLFQLRIPIYVGSPIITTFQLFKMTFSTSTTFHTSRSIDLFITFFSFSHEVTTKLSF
jgi:hypothetical protein